MKTKKKFLPKVIALVNIAFIFISPMVNAQSKNEIQKLNETLIFDFFINYELTEKNGNLPVIIDFAPKRDIKDCKSVNITSNVGGENQHVEYTFNKKAKIEKITYQVNGKVYNYQLNYEGGLVSSVNISGTKKISFVYDKSGKLTTIVRDKRGAIFEYGLEYVEGENKANIKLIVVQGEKRRPSSRKYYVSWNDQLQLDGFNFDVYFTKKINYSNNGDISSFVFNNTNDSNVEFSWNYGAEDKQGNWSKRDAGETSFNRTINY